MRLDKLLLYLTESVNIDELNSKVGNDVPASTLDALASKMRGNKYDKLALAIIKAIQYNNTAKIAFTKKGAEFAQYLEKHPVMVYAALKKAKRGDPKFNADEVIKDSYKSKLESPKKYWYSVYSSEPNEDERFGLKNARIKDMGEEFIYFPKTFKKIDVFGLSDDDLDKQWKDIRALSDQMAKLDKSGETDEDDLQVKKASDNHWCVASSNDVFYKDYKDFGGLFAIIVKKKPNGSPDFSRRYLFYVGNPEDAEWPTAKRYEFADKFDVHVNPDHYLSKKTSDFLYKYLNPSSIKKEKQRDEAYDRVHKAFESQKKSYKSGGEEWNAIKALTVLLNNKARLDNNNKQTVNSDYINRMFVPFRKNDYKGGDKYLKGNKNLTAYYNKYRTPRYISLPYDLHLTPDENTKRYSIKGEDKKFVCYLDDPDMLKKVKSYLDSYVADGPDKIPF